jgi:hypothetical protein
MAITNLPATTGFPPTTCDADVKRLETGGHETHSGTGDVEGILLVIFKVGTPGPEKPHRYFRSIVRGLGGDFHLAGGHARVMGGGKYYVEDRSAGSESPFWVRRDIGLERALREVNGFVPKHRGPDTYVATQFLKGRKKCLALWRSM